MGDMDPEDTKSLDSGDSMALTAEENHSSNSDMVHLEREEAELLEEAEKEEKERTAEEEEEEEDEELQTSVLSILGGEREAFEEEQELQAPIPEELLESVEESGDSCLEKKPAEFTQVAMVTTLPPLPIVKLDPPSTTSTPVQSITTAEAEKLYCAEGLRPPSILVSAEPLEENEEQQFQQIPLSGEPPAEKKTSTPPKTSQPTLSSTELMCGGAALVAVVGVVAYGAVAYCRK